MYNLKGTNRCHLFELISEYVWDSIVHNHKYKTHKQETGITSDIIALIRAHSELNQNFGIWSNNSISEEDYGGDLDIFVETKTNEFVWYALQAKILKQDGAYERLKSKSQWSKLEKLKRYSGCIPFFLFYNGLDRKVRTLQDCCGHDITEKQFGCSIVASKDVNNIATKISRPDYDDLYQNMHPWRELVCCDVKRKNATIYTLSQVKNAVELYEQVLNVENLRRGSQMQPQIIGNDLNIKTLNQLLDRKPEYSMVIRTTDGMSQT